MAIINDNDMEIIIGDDQKDAIKKMLNDRLFCLINMPAKKPNDIISKFSSSVFVGHMNDRLVRTFAIRAAGTNTVYEDCAFYLSLYYTRGEEEKDKSIFEQRMERKKEHSIFCKNLTVDELITFLDGKELVLITNYMGYGNMEVLKVNDFLNKLILIREENEAKFILRDESCDIRVYLRRVAGDDSCSKQGLRLEDINNFDIGHRIGEIFRKKCKSYFDDDNFYFAEYMAKTEKVQALYFVTRFHSNHNWDADPVNIINARISALVLPGKASGCDTEKLSENAKTMNNVRNEEYVIDSIHFNSDVFYDLTEFAKFVDSYILYFSYD